MNQLTIEHLAPYLGHRLMVWHRRHSYPRSTQVTELTPTILCHVEVGGLYTIKPLLRPLQDLTKEINHRGEVLRFIDLYEVGDDSPAPEFDNGNIQFIRKLETIAQHNIYHDVQYLPYSIVAIPRMRM